jgi:ATP-dependent Clp protease ATP-binding subunit ClpC
MDENFSPRVKDVISYSKEEALRLGHDVIGTEHLMLGLIREGEGSAIKILEGLHLDVSNFRGKVEGISIPNFQKEASIKKNLPFTRQAEKALKTTFLEAKLYHSSIIRTAHLLLCILRNEEDPVSRLLKHA